MKIELMKKVLAGAVIFSATMVAANAQAATAHLYQGPSGTLINTPGAPYTDMVRSFKGTLTMSRPLLPSITCVTTLNGYVSVQSGGLIGNITVTSGSVAAGGLCGIIGMSGFPWVSDNVAVGSLPSSPAANNSPVDVTWTNNLNVAPCGSNQTLTAKFYNRGSAINGGASTIEFDNALLSSSGCRLNGVLTIQGDDLDIYNM